MKAARLIKKSALFLWLVSLVIIALLFLFIYISGIFLFFSCSLYTDGLGFMYKEVYSETSPDGNYKLDIKSTRIQEGLHNDSFMYIVTVSDAHGKKNIISEFEGGLRMGVTASNISAVKWEAETVTVTITYDPSGTGNITEQKITLDYSLKGPPQTKPIFTEALLDIIKGIIIPVIILILTVSGAIVFISHLYRSHCRRVYNIDDTIPAPDNPDGEFKHSQIYKSRENNKSGISKKAQSHGSMNTTLAKIIKEKTDIKSTAGCIVIIIISSLLLLTILASAATAGINIIRLYSNSDKYEYQTVLIEHSPDRKFELTIQTAKTNKNDDSYICKILIQKTGYINQLVAEYEGFCHCQPSVNETGESQTPRLNVIDIFWDSSSNGGSENSAGDNEQEGRRVTVMLEDKNGKSQSITLDYSHNTEKRTINLKASFLESTKWILTLGALFILALVLTELFICRLYYTYCRNNSQKSTPSDMSPKSPPLDLL